MDDEDLDAAANRCDVCGLEREPYEIATRERGIILCRSCFTARGRRARKPDVPDPPKTD